MNEAFRVLNELMVNIFNNVLIIERKMLNSSEFNDLSITEMHTIEAIGLRQPGMMTEVASHINVTVGTLTVTVNNLVRKGYVERRRIEEDRRVVKVQLTDSGQKAFKAHEKFHTDMIKEIVKELNDEEEAVMIKTAGKLNAFFKYKCGYAEDD